jgi:hypothetical protein
MHKTGSNLVKVTSGLLEIRQFLSLVLWKPFSSLNLKYNSFLKNCSKNQKSWFSQEINVVRTSVLKPVRFQTLENQGKYKNLQKKICSGIGLISSKLHKNWNQWLLWRWDPPSTGLNLSLLVIFIFFVV